MTFDVVVCFYNHDEHFTHVLTGIEANKDYINEVIFVNDEDRRPIMPREISVPYRWLWHPHDGFGFTKSANQGIKAASTEYVLLIEGNEMLSPHSLQEMAETLSTHTITPRICLMAGRKRYLNPDRLKDNILEFTDDDPRKQLLKNPIWEATRPWVFFSSGHLLINKQAHDEIGGFNEEFEGVYHNADYAARMILKHGRESVCYGAGESWHIGSCRSRVRPSAKDGYLFARTAAQMFDHRYIIAWPDYGDTAWALNLLPNVTSDVYPLDLDTLEFIEDGEAALIECGSWVMDRYRVNPAKFINLVARKLKPGGTASFMSTFPKELYTGMIEAAGLVIESESPVVEVMKPEDNDE